jgi:hypothetical protein
LSSNIVHQYFKKDLTGMKILMKVDVLRLRAVELRVPDDGPLSWEETDINEDAVNQLMADGFQQSGPLEFNLYEAGLAGPRTE